jgi:hypothetical protein
VILTENKVPDWMELILASTFPFHQHEIVKNYTGSGADNKNLKKYLATVEMKDNELYMKAQLLVPSQEFFNNVREDDKDRTKRYVGQGEIIFVVDNKSKGSNLVIDVDQKIYSQHHEKLLAFMITTAIRTPPQGFSFPDMLKRVRASIRNNIRGFYQKVIFKKLVGISTRKSNEDIQRKQKKEGNASDKNPNDSVCSVLALTDNGSASTQDSCNEEGHTLTRPENSNINISMDPVQDTSSVLNILSNTDGPYFTESGNDNENDVSDDVDEYPELAIEMQTELFDVSVEEV